MSQMLTLSRPLEGLRRRALRLGAGARRVWRAHPRETIGAGFLGVVATLAAAGTVTVGLSHNDAAQAAPPAPPPLIMRQIEPAEALKVNAAIPVTHGANPAATPFAFKGDSGARKQALECLASAVYYEAGDQGSDGERAVAQVVLNRVRHPAFPSSVCGVVYEGSTRTTGCQFTFTCNGSLYRKPDADGWRRAYKIAEAALAGYVYKPVGWATHYHADYVVPYWASTLAKNAMVGAHIFYRWAGAWGQPGSFTDKYAGREPNAAALRTAALSVEHMTGAPSSVASAIEKIPGAEPIKLTPSMRGEKRVAVRFNLVARKAADEAPHEDYAKKFDASDNLKWSLSGNPIAENAPPLGKSATAPETGSVMASAQR
jgi:spore germination cell wall hydrolase CwlJ-like protein